ncbi:TetR family transcriptional regulator [Novosphingobium sp.]|uniref:TetR family transcriptional regulator n=1 Tax=Novosphingobium sp. TaxID=1874826 RepID=UPI003B51C7F1
MNDSEMTARSALPAEPAEQQGARDLLLATASQIMRDGDQVDISLSELSLRSGLNSALVKYYFGNKAGMLAALLDRDMVAIVRSVEALMARDDMPPEEKLRRHISRCIDTYYAVPYLNRLLMRLVRDSDDDEARRVADKYLTPLRVFYDSLISAGVAQGVFRQVDPQLFYFTVTGAADRFFSARLVLRHCYGEEPLSEELRDRYREHTVDFIMAGISAHG